MATYSANVTQKIAGGGVFNFTTAGTHVIVTTAANQKAKVYIMALASTGDGLTTLRVDGVTMASVPAATTLINLEPAALAAERSVLVFEVPPSTTADIVIAGTSLASLRARGVYVIEENTP